MTKLSDSKLVNPEAFHALASGADCSVSALAAPSAARATVFAACSALPDILEIGLVDGVTRSSLCSGKNWPQTGPNDMVLAGTSLPQVVGAAWRAAVAIAVTVPAAPLTAVRAMILLASTLVTLWALVSHQWSAGAGVEATPAVIRRVAVIMAAVSVDPLALQLLPPLLS